jgi:hypothetical protein
MQLKTPLLVIIACSSLACLVMEIYHFTREESDLAVVRDFFVNERDLSFETHPTRDVPPLAAADGTESIVIARCFQGDEGVLVGWLERYTTEGKAAMEALSTEDRSKPDQVIAASLQKEVRLPTSGVWVPIASPAGQAICIPPKRSDGSSATPAMP